MNQLSIREKVMLAIGVLGIILVIFYFGVPWLQGQIGGGEAAQATREELERIQTVLSFRRAADQIEDYLRTQTGLYGDAVIPADLLDQIRDKITLEADPAHPERVNINKPTEKDLNALGLDKQQVMSIQRYRQRIGRFESLEQLGELRKTLFEGQDEQAVILERLARIAKETGIKPKDLLQIEPRLTRSTRSEMLPGSVRSACVTQLYLYELEQEAEEIQKRMEAEQTASATPLTSQRRWFDPLPDDIPAPWRLKLIEIIRKRQGDIGVRLVEKKGDTLRSALTQALAALNTTEDQVEVDVVEKGRRGLLGLGKKPVQIRVTYQDPEEGLVAFFHNMRTETDEDVDRTSLETSLKRYVRKFAEKRHELIQLLKKIPMSYNRRSYIVEMAFKGEMDKLVRLIEKIESEHKWIRMRGLKISIADEKKTFLQANLTMIATIL